MHDEALEAAARAICCPSGVCEAEGVWNGGPCTAWTDEELDQARAAILAFLEGVQVNGTMMREWDEEIDSLARIAMDSNTEMTGTAILAIEKNAAGAKDLARKRVRAALAQLRREIAGGDREAPIL